jgi:hypothetical protein
VFYSSHGNSQTADSRDDKKGQQKRGEFAAAAAGQEGVEKQKIVPVSGAQ